MNIALFILLIFVISLPFWLFGATPLPLPINLPTSALQFVAPLMAASILVYQHHGLAGVKRLFARAFDYQKIENKRWYIPTLLTMPLIMYLSYWVMRVAGMPLPDPIEIPWFIIPLFCLLFLIPALCEELGWMGYAIHPLQARWGALGASVMIGIVWGVWHSVPYFQTRNPVDWIIWQSLSAVSLRILIVWIYNNTNGSVFTSILFHTMVNVSEFSFPNYGSHYDPFVADLLSFTLAGIVIFVWGAKTLRDSRFA